jgi:hypothetical protein
MMNARYVEPRHKPVLESDHWIEFVHGIWTARCPDGQQMREALHAHGWRRVYQPANLDGYYYARWWLAPFVRAAAKLRDETVRGWGQHCADMGLLKEYEPCPWPKFLRFFW